MWNIEFKKNTKSKLLFGIQNKYLLYTVIMLSLSLFLSGMGIGLYTWKDIKASVVDKYTYMNREVGTAFDNAYRKSDETMENAIVSDLVQKSLTVQGISTLEGKSLVESFAHVNMDYVSEYVYVDNKEQVYTRFYQDIPYQDFAEEDFIEQLDETYSRTMWIWRPDTLFQTGEESLFIGRLARSMDYTNRIGYLVFRMDEGFFEEMISNIPDTAEVIVGIMDERGAVCKQWIPEGYYMSEESLEAVADLAAGGRAGKGQLDVREGIVLSYAHEDTGFTVFTLIPNQILNSSIMRLLAILIAVFLIVLVIAVSLSVFFAKRFTRPIREIETAMTGFDGSDFSALLDIQTNTELDDIGASYNMMLKNIEALMDEIRQQERSLRQSELNALIHQINPHFLYNALDTIYMLARINKEETTMKMIQALSKYLRVTLSKGNDTITLEEELENVKSFMEIQKIRNEDLFDYEIDCRVDASRIMVLKLILQPLVENGIKYGFRDIFDGGFIRISIAWEGDVLQIHVYNSGTSIESEMEDRINHAAALDGARVDELKEDKNSGYGVMNIISRLKLKYRDKASICYRKMEEGTDVCIEIAREEVV